MEYISVSQYAEKYGISERTVRNYCAIYIIIMLLMPSVVAAQGGRERLRHRLERADSLLTVHYYKGRFDTNYMSRAPGRLMLRMRLNLAGAAIEAEGNTVSPFRSRAEAAYKGTLSAAATYKGLTLSLSLNPGLLLGKYRDYELDFNSYGNKWGFDIIYQRAKNFTGWLEHGDEGRTDIPRDLLTLQTLNINTYYAFNNRRFSYPAAFTQSYVQKRSAGSWMLAASFQGQYLDIRADEGLGNKATSLQVANFGIGGGYGYNFVLPHKWLIHISGLPTLTVVSRNHITIDGERQDMRYHFPQVIITGRGAVVHYMKRRFAGASMTFNFTNIGNRKHLEVMNTKWRARAFWGIRF